MKRPRTPRLLRLSAPALAVALVSCRAGIFDNDDPRWRVPEDRLRGIDRLDPVAASTSPPATLDDAARGVLEEVARPPVGDAAMPLTLAEVRAAVLGGNLDLRTALVDPAIARANLSAEEAKFESAFFAEYNRSNASLFTDVATGLPASDESFNAGLRVPLATGGEIDLSAPLNQGAAGIQFEPGDDWLAAVSFSISQPLLRGAGVAANTHSIRVAEWQGQIADARTKLEAIRVVSNADKAYWNLYSAYRELDVRRAQYDLAVKQLERAKRRVAQGEAPQIEVVRAESGIGRTLEQIIVADSNLRIRQRALKRLMNRGDLPVAGETSLRPASDPAPLGLRLDGGKLAAQAVAGRMEMLELELQLAIDESEIGFRRNAALPLFLLDYTYNLQGAGSDPQYAYRDLGDADNFSVGLRAEIPLGNEAAESRVNAAVLARVQRLATREARRQSIETEVYDALDALAQSWQRILAARLETALAARTLAAEERQFDVGLRTSTDVLDAAASLADAQSREVAALASWQIALVDIAFATGTTLGNARIRWESFTDEEIRRMSEDERMLDAAPESDAAGFREDAEGSGTGG